MLRYVSPGGALDPAWNFNGSARAIAGVVNERGNVMGLMPHPERCAEEVLGNTDGLELFAGLVASAAARPRPRRGRRPAGQAQGGAPARRPPMTVFAGIREPAVDLELARAHGLSDEEYERLRGFLGRDPNFTELGITSALWSEHCSYKSSKVYLREFPTAGPHVLQGPGENAGVVDIGHGWVAVFKMESHNHPSYIEPYQGAATGVGGILRDVFTMGARPIACLDSLRFGDSRRAAHALAGRRRGARHRRLRQLRRHPDGGRRDRLPPAATTATSWSTPSRSASRGATASSSARASGAGNPILYAGSRTGRDGIHGATMASESFDAESRAEAADGAGRRSRSPRRSCSRPASRRCAPGAIVAIQDMGAAGLTSSSFEMAGRGGAGIRLELDRVPLREPGLTPYEIMLSESQERMLVVAQRGREEEVARVFRRWGLEVATIGEVTATGRAEISLRRRDASPTCRSRRSPTRRRSTSGRSREPADLRAAPGGARGARAAGARSATRSRALLETPELASKEWIWRQYDHTVRTNTVQGPGGDAAVLLLKGTPAGLALDLRRQPGLLLRSIRAAAACRRWPRRRATWPASAPSRSGSPTASTSATRKSPRSCGSSASACAAWPRPAARSACRSSPATSRFYNETEGRNIHPTPTVAMVGVIPNLGNLPDAGFARAGDRILLLGEDAASSAARPTCACCSASSRAGRRTVDLDAERRGSQLLRELAARRSGAHRARPRRGRARGGARRGLLRRAGSARGSTVPIGAAALFSETQARAIVAAAPGSARARAARRRAGRRAGARGGRGRAAASW